MRACVQVRTCCLHTYAIERASRHHAYVTVDGQNESLAGQSCTCLLSAGYVHVELLEVAAGCQGVVNRWE